MRKKANARRARRHAGQRKNAPAVLSNLVENFEKDNAALVEALRVFGISNAEYERAMLALTQVPVRTCASTQTPEGGDAFVE
jgi:hypothetical protein